MGIFDIFFGKKEETLKKEEKFSLDTFRQLVEEDKKIEAIKMVRIFTGTGLKEAKDFVEHYQSTGCSWDAVKEAYCDIACKLTEVPDRSNNEGRDIFPYEKTHGEEEIEHLLKKGQKIMAIKRVRELTGVGLKEAKDFVDYLEEVNMSWEDAFHRFNDIEKKMNMEQNPVIEANETGDVNTVWLNLTPQEQKACSYERRIEIEDLIRQGNKIMAIKIIREITGRGLKEAKDLADAIGVAQSGR
ncbi:MAG: ribosomal protein L7/L12 [Candidatus Eremiobacterota bacterium]